MSEESHAICPICRDEVEPSDPDVVYAVKMVRAHTMGGTTQAKGTGDFFHRRCFPQDSKRYKLVPKPDDGP